MKIALIGKQASITHWLEDAAAAFAAGGHEVQVSFTRRPWLQESLESALLEPIAARIAGRIARFAPDMILAIGAYHVPLRILERIAALPGRAPLIGWVGDLFDPEARAAASAFDAVAYTDSGLVARHRDLGFPGEAFYLPHAVNPFGAPAPAAAQARVRRMVFVGNPTPLRVAAMAAIRDPMAIHGPGWRPADLPVHEVHPGRARPGAAIRLYAGHLAALNIRNEGHVLAGLNQRSFEPCLAGAVLLADDQPDLARCYEPGAEVLVWQTLEALNDTYARVLADASWAAGIGEQGRRRTLADHTFEHRLAALKARF